MFSATQAKDFELCPRRWGWRKLDGIVIVPGPAATFGIRMHSSIEGYLGRGEPIDLTTPHGLAAIEGAHLWPQPLTCEVERHFTVSVGRHVFQGYIDVSMPREVIDHKSTSDFKWAKTPEELVTDIQAALYAHEALQRVDWVMCTWIYYRRNPPYRTKVVRATVTAVDIAPTIRRLELLADEMSAIQTAGLKTLDLLYNVDACEAFGGCPYRELCNLTPQQKLEGMMSQDFAAAKAAFAAKFGGAPGINPPTGNPWDGLPDTHLTKTHWFDVQRNDWFEKAPPPLGNLNTLAAFAAAAPAAVAPPPPPPPPPPAAVAPPPPPPAAANGEAPRKAGRPPGSKNRPKVVQADGSIAPDPWDAVADALIALAEAVRAL